MKNLRNPSSPGSVSTSRFHLKKGVRRIERFRRFEFLERRDLLAGDVLLSEFMASNADTLKDDDGESVDWIELYNGSLSTIDLSGWAISDDAKNRSKWVFPSVQLNANEFLVLFASGKNRSASDAPFHTNFKLSKNGEYLGLSRPDGSIADEYVSAYPTQRTDVSYGRSTDREKGREGYMTSPTPGEANGVMYLGFVSAPQFSDRGGFMDAPMEITISHPEDVVIRYTVDGSIPTETNGTIYAMPIEISTTATIRAAAFRSDFVPSQTITASYIFLEKVLLQTQPALYPDLPSGDYDVDPDISQSLQYKDRMLAGFHELESLSLVLPVEDFVGPQGIYTHPTSRGDRWERATSAELIGPDGNSKFQIDAGLRIQGGASRDPSQPKHSFSIRFRNKYGSGDLDYPLFSNTPVDTFSSLSLRAGSNNSWTSTHAIDRRHAQSIRDQWIRDSLSDMGHVDAGQGKFVHLFINGLYWGVFNLTERPDASHYANYFGGDASSYDAFNGNQVIDGSKEALDRMKAIAKSGDLQALESVLDIDHYIDYNILNRYGSNADLDVNRNYRLAGGGSGSAPIRIYPWDSEEVLISAGSTGTPTDPLGIRNDLEKLLEFRVRFGDRLQKHLLNRGALTPEETANRWRRRADELDLAIIGESARWGDHHRPDRPYERDVEWVTEQNVLLKDYFPRRSEVLLRLFRDDGLFPSVEAPVFHQHGGLVPQSFQIQLRSDSGTIHFTTDGSDPRLPGGEIRDTAQIYDGPIALSGRTLVKARTLVDGVWSALNEATFDLRSELPLRLTEINAHPHVANPVDALAEQEVDRSQFEFLEFTNRGVEPINLNGVRLTSTKVRFEDHGVTFHFASQILNPNERMVIVRDRDAFLSRYGSDVSIAQGNDGIGGPSGQYGGELADAGEQLTLVDASGSIIQQFDYGQRLADLDRANGVGSSLEWTDQASSVGMENWQASLDFGGSPGRDPTPTSPVAISEISTYADLQTMTEGWVELENSTEEPIDITHWYLSDSARDLFQFQVSKPVTIPAGGFHLFHQSTLEFGFDRIHGGEVWLIAANENGVPVTFADNIIYPTSFPANTLGRASDDSNALVQLSFATKKQSNSAPYVGDVVISEVNYASSDLDGPDVGLQAHNFEFVELFNRSTNDVDLKGWRISGDIDYAFRKKTILPSGKTILVVNILPTRGTQATPFRAAYGIDRDVAMAGPYLGFLNNSGTIRLQTPLPSPANEPFFTPFVTVDEIHFGSQFPWPTQPADTDPSETSQTLNRNRASRFGSQPSNWNSLPVSPGAADLTLRLDGDANEDGRFDSGDLVIAFQSGKFATGLPATFAEGDWNDDGFFDNEDLIAVLALGHFQG